MADPGGVRPPYHAVVALCAWGLTHWSDLRYAWGQSGRPGEILDLNCRELGIFIYGYLMERMPDEASREKLRTALHRSDAQASDEAPEDYSHVEGIPEDWRPDVDVAVPDWWDGGGYEGTGDLSKRVDAASRSDQPKRASD